MLVGVLTRVLLHPVYDLKAAQMNVQHSLICKLMLYKFILGYDAAEATKKFTVGEDEGTVDDCTVTKWLKNLRSKKFEVQVRLKLWI